MVLHIIYFFFSRPFTNIEHDNVFLVTIYTTSKRKKNTEPQSLDFSGIRLVSNEWLLDHARNDILNLAVFHVFFKSHLNNEKDSGTCGRFVVNLNILETQPVSSIPFPSFRHFISCFVLPYPSTQQLHVVANPEKHLTITRPPDPQQTVHTAHPSGI